MDSLGNHMMEEQDLIRYAFTKWQQRSGEGEDCKVRSLCPPALRGPRRGGLLRVKDLLNPHPEVRALGEPRRVGDARSVDANAF